jgi:hypothetical protein
VIGTSDAVFEGIGAAPSVGFEGELCNETIEALRGVLGEDRWAQAYAEGRSVPLEDVLPQFFARLSDASAYDGQVLPEVPSLGAND